MNAKKLTACRRIGVFLVIAGAFLLIRAGQVSAIMPTPEETALADLIRLDPGQQRPSMTYSPSLNAVARGKARDLATRGYFSHTDPDGYGPNWGVKLSEFTLPAWYDQSLGANNVESLAAGTATAQDTFNMWISDLPHRQHILGETAFWQDQTYYGVGHWYDPSSPYGHYWSFVSAPPDPAAVLKPYIEWQLMNQTLASINSSNLGGGWKWLPWLDFFCGTSYPWIYHDEHHWMYWYGTSTAAIWFYTTDMGWLYTSDTLYPNLYRGSDGAWLWYLRGESNPRWFYNFTTHAWEWRYPP